MRPTLPHSLRTLFLALAVLGLLAPAVAKPRAAAAPVVFTDSCSWDRPGHNPFMGDVVAAVDRYQDIAVDVRERIKARMLKRDYDDLVSIRRDKISGRAGVRYGSTIRDMHFGKQQICRSVSRAAWSAQMQERGLVYCDSGECILVPTVCRNVSRIARAEVADERAEGELPAPEGPPVAAVVEPQPAPPPFDVAAPLPGFDAGPSFESSSRGGPGFDVAAALPDFDAGPGFESSRGGSGFSGGGFGGGGAFGGGSANGSAAIGGFSGGAQASPPHEVTQAFADTQIPGAITPVPEPETWGLMLGGVAALAAWRRRRPD